MSELNVLVVTDNRVTAKLDPVQYALEITLLACQWTRTSRLGSPMDHTKEIH